MCLCKGRQRRRKMPSQFLETMALFKRRASPPPYSDFCFLCTTREFIDDAMHFVRENYIPIIAPPPAGENIGTHAAAGLIISAFCFVLYPRKAREFSSIRPLTDDAMAAAAELVDTLIEFFASSSSIGNKNGKRNSRRMVDDEEDDDEDDDSSDHTTTTTTTRKRPREDASLRALLRAHMLSFETACKAWQNAQMPFIISFLRESMVRGQVLDPVDTLPFPLSATQLFPRHPAVMALHPSSFHQCHCGPSSSATATTKTTIKMTTEKEKGSAERAAAGGKEEEEVNEALFRRMRGERIGELISTMQGRVGTATAVRMINEAHILRHALFLRKQIHSLTGRRTAMLADWMEGYTDKFVGYIEAEIEYLLMKLQKLIGKRYKEFVANEFERCSLRGPLPPARLTDKEHEFAEQMLSSSSHHHR